MDVEVNSYTCPMSAEGAAFAINFNYWKIRSLGRTMSPSFTVGRHEFCMSILAPSFTVTGHGNLWNDLQAVLHFKIQQKQENVASVISDVYLLNKEGEPSWDTLMRSSTKSLNPLNSFTHFFLSDVTKYMDIQGHVVVICVIKLEGESQFDMQEDISKLLEKGEMSDVTFQVAKESFDAHKLILAARSSVFKDKLFGSMAESGTGMKSIMIKDMQPDVFKAMLHFIYTDSLPILGDEKASVMLAQHLIVAADRYAVERLKLICEEMLSKRIALDTVVSLLALAERHNCTKLKNACLMFIVVSKNRADLSFNMEYLELMLSSPSLMAEIQALVGQNEFIFQGNYAESKKDW